MNDYQKEQLDALKQLGHALKRLSTVDRKAIADAMRPYVTFRSTVDRFTGNHCKPLCTRACFENQKSACCSKDGIITFWADWVVNVMNSNAQQLARLEDAIRTPYFSSKCIYLTPTGCIWRIRPLVCAFFVCDTIQSELLDRDPAMAGKWQTFETQAKQFRWPDQPVLFDTLEAVFISAGCDSPLMYLSKSPGLLRIKQRAGLIR